MNRHPRHSAVSRTAAAGSSWSTSLYHRRDGDEIHDGILGCHCCIFPVIDGIPVMHLQPRRRPRRGRTSRPASRDMALRMMVGLATRRRRRVSTSRPLRTTATYRELVEALGPSSRAATSCYRFSDPTLRRRHAVVRAVAGTVLPDGGRAIDVCGGSGHLTRSLMELSSPPPVLADLYFAEDLAGAAVHGAGMRGGVLRRQRADAVRPRRLRATRCAPTRSCSSGPSGSSSARCCV